MKVEFLARRLAPVPVVCVSATGPYERTTRETWEHLKGLLAMHAPTETYRAVFALLHDLPHEVRPEARRIEMCAQIDASTLRKLEGVAHVRTFSGGSYLTTTHRGAYDRLPAEFAQMYAACSVDMSVALDPGRPRIIVFKRDPASCPPAELEAEIGLPCCHVGDEVRHSAHRPASTSRSFNGPRASSEAG